MAAGNGPIGVGIIGASPDRGWALNAHIPALQALPQFRIAAVSTSRPESAAAAAEKFGVPAFASADDLVVHPDVDLVVITVKVPQHAALARAAIAAGKHVYCEWPLGNGTAEAVEMAELADSAGVRGFVGLQGRFNPTVQQVIQLLQEGYVGEILSTSIIGSGAAWGGRTDSANAYLSDAGNGATMMTIPMGHTLDAISYALGEFEPDHAVMALRRRQVSIVDTGATLVPTAPDQIAVIGRFGPQITASVHYRGGLCRGTNLLWEINGTEGDLQVSAATGHIQMGAAELRGARGADAMQPLPIAPEHRWVPDSVPAGPAVNVAQAYAKVAQALAGEDSGAPTFRDAVRRHRMIDAIRAVANG